MKKNTIQKMLLIFINNIIICMVTSCKSPLPQPMQVEDNSFVLAIGIDKGIEDENNIRLTLISKKFYSEDNKKNMSDNQDSDIYTVEGKTISEAARKFYSFKYKNLFWGHAKFLLLGENVAKKNILDFLDFLIRDHEIRLNMKTIIVKGFTAEKIISMSKISDYFVPDILEGLFNNSGELSISREVRLSEAITILDNKYEDLILPSITMIKAGNSEKNYKSYIDLDGFGVFNGTYLLGFIKDDTARGLNWITGNVYSGILTVKDVSDKNVSLEIIDASSKINCKFNNNLPEVAINIKISTDLNEQQSQEILLNESSINSLNKKLINSVKAEAEKAIDFAQKNNVDIFGIGDELYHKYPLKWNKIKSDWKKVFSEMKINIYVNSEIKRTDLLNDPIRSESGD